MLAWGATWAKLGVTSTSARRRVQSSPPKTSFWKVGLRQVSSLCPSAVKNTRPSPYRCAQVTGYGGQHSFGCLDDAHGILAGHELVFAFDGVFVAAGEAGQDDGFFTVYQVAAVEFSAHVYRKAAAAQGFRCIAYGGDLWLYQQALRHGISALRGPG